MIHNKGKYNTEHSWERAFTLYLMWYAVHIIEEFMDMLRLVLQNARGWIHTTEQETREGKHTHRVQPNLLLLAEASALFNKLWAAVWWHSAGLRPTWRKYMWCKRKSERSSYWDIAKCIQSNATYYLLGQKWNNEWPITALPSIIDTLLSYRLSAGLETIRAVNYMLKSDLQPI